MNIVVVLRNLYGNPDPFEDELIIGDSDVNAISEACELRDWFNNKNESNDSSSLNQCEVTALLFSESESDSKTVLTKAASYGADKVIHAEVDDFDFTDANLFSRLIANTISELGSHTDDAPIDSSDSSDSSKESKARAVDILMFGRLAYDGDSVNIATQTAARLGWTKAIYSKEIHGVFDEGASMECEAPRSILRFTKSLDGGSTAQASAHLPLVLHSIRKENLRRQAKVSDILRAYGNGSDGSGIKVSKIQPDVMAKLISASLSGPTLGKGIQEIPPYSQATEMINLNGISDVETSQNIIDVLKSLGFEPKPKK